MAEFSKFLQQVQDFASKAEQAAKEAGKQVSTTVNQAYTTATQAYETVAPTINDITKNAGELASQIYIAAEDKTSEAVSYLKEQVESIGDEAPKVLSLDEVGRKIASLGTPALAFVVTSSVVAGTGLAGGAVMTTTLALLGGPLGMVGGLITLGVLTLIGDAFSKYGIDAVLIATFKARQEVGIPIKQIQNEINSLWISEELKYKINQQLAVLNALSQPPNDERQEIAIVG